MDPSVIFATVDECASWASALVLRLEERCPPDAGDLIWPAYKELRNDRALPGRICHWLQTERCNPPFELDIGGNPLQVILARSRHWRFLMYVWLPTVENHEPAVTAHDHSSEGFSLIHSGNCYVERQYTRNAAGSVTLQRTYAPKPGETRRILPQLLHAVDPAPSGGFSFILWGPRARSTTTVVDVRDGTTRSYESEHVDRVEHVLSAVARYGLQELVTAQ